jgi:hypothetical protein
MAYHGDIRLSKTFDFKFTTINGSGVPSTLGGSPTLCAYPDNSTTQITAGLTLTVDFDSKTGLNNVRVVATSGNGYATATNYTVVLEAGTVDGTSVANYVVGSFSIEARSPLMPATADRTLVVDASGLADANAVKVGPTGSGTAQTARDLGASVLLSSGTGTGQVKLASGYVAPNWGDVGNPTTTVGLSGTTVKTATDVETDTQDIQARLPAALTAGGNIKADALAINGSTSAAALQSYAALGIVSGLAQTGTLSSTQATTDLTEATNDHYNDRALVFITGTLAGLAVRITDYDGSTKMLTYSATPTGESPSNNDRFIIV